MSKPILSQKVVDLTVDVGSWGGPLVLKNEHATREKLMLANDKFFDIWEDCLFLMVVNSKSDNRLVVHCMTSPSNSARLHSQSGWILAYFQECLVD